MSIFDALESGDCEQILTHIAQINRTNEAGETPLMMAVQKRDVTAIKILLENNADREVKRKDGTTLVGIAVQQGCIDIVILLLDFGANIEALDKNGDTALHLAVSINQTEIVKFLLERGANVNARRQYGSSPLVEAVYEGYEDMVKLLLQHGADCNISTTPHHSSALSWAVDKGYHTIAKMLLDAGANPFHIIQNGSSVLSLACDDNMKFLIREYQRVEGPSWLVRELSKRNLEWSVVCDTQDKLKKAQITCQHSILHIPSTLFTHTYLQDIGINILAVRCALLEMRAQATWLGARLAAQGESVANMLFWEHFVFETLGCSTEASFAVLPEKVVQGASHHLLSAIHTRLLRVHREVCAEHTAGTSVNSTAPTVAPVTQTVAPPSTLPLRPAVSSTASKPQSSSSGYAIYATDMSLALKRRYPQTSDAQLTYLIDRYWSHMSAEEKTSYTLRAEQLKQVTATPEGVQEGVQVTNTAFTGTEQVSSQHIRSTASDAEVVASRVDTLEVEPHDKPSHELLPPLKRSRFGDDSSIPPFDSAAAFHSDSDSGSDSSDDGYTMVGEGKYCK